jgi:hypothetical protein
MVSLIQRASTLYMTDTVSVALIFGGFLRVIYACINGLHGICIWECALHSSDADVDNVA